MRTLLLGLGFLAAAAGYGATYLDHPPAVETWTETTTQAIKTRHAKLSQALQDRVALAAAYGDRALSWVTPAGDNSHAVRAPVTRATREAWFDSLAHAAQALRRQLPPGEGIGAGVSLQLFAPDGELLAWAGAPQDAPTTRRLGPPGRGERQVYFVRAASQILLVYDRQPGRIAGSPGRPVPADGARAASQAAPRVRVTLPVHALSRIGERAAPAWDLERAAAGDGLDLEIDWDPRSIPPYLTRTPLELTGQALHGLRAEGLIQIPEATARILVRWSTAPYEEVVAAHAATSRRWRAYALVVAGWFVWLLGLRVAARRSEPGDTLPVALVWLVGLWGFRVLGRVLELPAPPSPGSTLLDPAIVSLAFPGDLLRTPLDLLWTAATLAASALVIFVAVASRRTAIGSAAGSLGDDAAAVSATPPASRWAERAQALLRVALAIPVAYGTVWLALEFAHRMARNASPPLLGEGVDLLQPEVAILHLGLLVGLCGILALVGLVLAAWLPAALERRGAALALLVVAVAAVFVPGGPSPLVSGLLAAYLLGAARLRGLLRDERFTSFGLATFALVALAATISSQALHASMQAKREQAALAQAEAVRRLLDPRRHFLLERLLDTLSRQPSNHSGPRSGGDSSEDLVAYEIWSSTFLADLEWPCQVRVYDIYPGDIGKPVGTFSIGMPWTESAPDEAFIARALREARIEQTEVRTRPSGRLRLYRGAVLQRPGRAGQPRHLVVLDLPFGREGLAPIMERVEGAGSVARAGGIRSGGLPALGAAAGASSAGAPILAWMEQGTVVESSSPLLQVGRALDDRPAPGTWVNLDLGGATYRVTVVGRGDRVQLVGVPVGHPVTRLLEWAQVASFDFTVTLAALLLLLAAARLPALRSSLPPLLIPKRIGFQQKLMLAFLVVALLPSVVISLATRDIMEDRSVRRNRDLALEKVRSAAAALADLLRRETDTILQSEYLRVLLRSEGQGFVARDVGDLEVSRIMVFHGEGRLVVDETLSDLPDSTVLEYVVETPPPLFAADWEQGLRLGTRVPFWFSPATGDPGQNQPGAQLYYLVYWRRLTDDVLEDLGPILNADISAFLGPRLEASSRRSLVLAGLLPSLAPPQAYEQLLLRDNRFALLEERRDDRVYFAGYLPLQDRRGRPVGILSVSRLLQPDEFAAEVERTRALVVGLSTLMFVLTLVLGVAFATTIFDPVRNLIEGTRRLARGELGFRLRARSTDEIGELERSFNDMAARLETALAALEERRRYLEAVLGNIASGVVATDRHGRVTAANEAARRILGVGTEELQGADWRQRLESTSDEGLRAFWKHVGEAPEGEVAELTLRTGDEPQTLRIIVTDLRPSGNPEGESLGRVAIFEDITELIRSKKLAAWAQMARQVAHEIKNPLAPLKAEAQLLQRAWVDDSERFGRLFDEGIQTIIQQVDRLRRIATEFSNFGRVQKLEVQPVRLARVLDATLRPYRGMQGLEVERLESAPEAADVEVLADAEGLHKVFANLLENARESMRGHGRIRVRVEAPEDGHVEVRVEDEGEGVQPETLQQLFEPYFSTKSTGTGLGLAICRGILEELGGSITLENRPGGGAVARVRLRLA